MITKVDKIEAQRLMDSGFSDQEIGERLGCSRQRIHQLRHSWQLPQRLAVVDAKIKQGLADGLTCKEVEWRLGCSDDRVYRSAKRQGITELNTPKNLGRPFSSPSRALERRRRVIEALRHGYTVTEIADLLNLPNWQIYDDIRIARSAS